MAPHRIRYGISGFTLVELMIVVAIIGLLAALAIPAFSRYVRQARTSEAVGHLNKEWVGSLSYYESEHTIAFGVVLTKEFPGPSAAWPIGGSTCVPVTCAGCGIPLKTMCNQGAPVVMFLLSCLAVFQVVESKIPALSTDRGNILSIYDR